MEESLGLVYEDTKERMAAAIDRLKKDLGKLRAGKASVQMLDGLMVDYYGTPTPLPQVATLSAPDARTLVIQPWEKKMINEIEKTIFASSLGITPANDGIVIRLILPPLTEERRRNLVKEVKSMGETTKVALRNLRRDANEEIKAFKKDGLSEDSAKDAEAEIQKFTDAFIVKIDEALKAKENDILTL